MIKKFLFVFMIFFAVFAENQFPSQSNSGNLLLMKNTGCENPAVFPNPYVSLYSPQIQPDYKGIFKEIRQKEKPVLPLVGMGLYLFTPAIAEEFSPKQNFIIQNDIQSTINYQLRQ